MRLSTTNFEKARRFIKTQARALDRSLFEHHFEGASAGAVLTELARYQNEDGGFGRSLEPDFRLEASSPLATSVAFQMLRELAAPADHPLARNGIAYFLKTFDGVRGGWQAAPQAVNAVPHAPWWTFDEAEGKVSPETPANPSAEIAGYLYAYAELVPPDFLAAVTGRVINHLEANHGAMAMFDLHCYRRMADELPQPQQDQVLALLRPAIANLVERDPAAWAGYVAQPLEFVKSPDSPYYSSLREATEANLDYAIQTQAEDGSWPPKWSWGDSYPDIWPTARQEWAGVLTVETLRILEAFDRIDR
jgi:hypothetical protein